MIRTAVILIWDHPVSVVPSLGFALGQGLAGLGVRVHYESVMDASLNPKHDEILRCVHDPGIADCDVAISMGAPPLSLVTEGRPLYEVLGRRFYLFSLDAMIYDYSRAAGVAGFLEQARQSNRLGIMSPDRDACVVLDELAPHPIGSYVPFGGCFRPLAESERARRVAVIGNMGSELADVSSGEAFERLVLAAPSGVPRGLLLDFAHEIQRPGAPLNVTSLARSFLGQSAQEIFTPEFTQYLASLDAFQKRRRRTLAVQQLRNVPVDFFGSGWEHVTGGFQDCRYMGVVSFDDVADICSRYGALLNFDPNWDYGLHDRVYTAVGTGCRVVTNSSGAVADLELPERETIQTYDANDPSAISDQLHRVLSLDAPDWESLRAFRQQNSWLARADDFLAMVR